MDMLINYEDKRPGPLQASQDWILENNKSPSTWVMENNSSTRQGFHPNTSLQTMPKVK